MLVICVHIANYYCRAVASISGFSYLTALGLNILSRLGVPFFFMISGALLLSRPYDREKNKRRILERFISLAGVTVIYYFWDKYAMGKKVHFGKSLLDSPQRALLWFMYAILAIYLALPFIKILADGMGPWEDGLFIFLWLFTNELRRHRVFRSYPVPIVEGAYYLGYFLIGYIILKHKDKLDYRKFAPGLGLILGVFVSVAFAKSRKHYLSSGLFWNKLLTYSNIYSMAASLCAFVLLYTFVSEKLRGAKAVKTISDLSFGIYLFHGIFLDAFLKIFPTER